MKMDFWLNNVHREAEVQPDTLLLDLLRQMGCFSVKRGCETANCGLCTVLLDGRPVLSCSMLALRSTGEKGCYPGRHGKRSPGVWRLSCRRGGRAVRLL